MKAKASDTSQMYFPRPQRFSANGRLQLVLIPLVSSSIGAHLPGSYQFSLLPITPYKLPVFTIFLREGKHAFLLHL